MTAYAPNDRVLVSPRYMAGAGDRLADAIGPLIHLFGWPLQHDAATGHVKIDSLGKTPLHRTEGHAPVSILNNLPFHGNPQWRNIRDNSPGEWVDVVEFDAAIRKENARANATGNRLLGEASLHRSRIPLSEAPIDYVTAAEWAALQQELGTEEATQQLEEGVTDGRSPWTCRGEIAATQDQFGLAT
ncbi:hypothetical protein OG885_10155 [Streptomyces sp. NBC_00028]|uniref:hypothetical protein n=1 Tax=Streptomyces sp. NBC_00028 TaxID=2975624 RepID=UPI003253F9FA